MFHSLRGSLKKLICPPPTSLSSYHYPALPESHIKPPKPNSKPNPPIICFILHLFDNLWLCSPPSFLTGHASYRCKFAQICWSNKLLVPDFLFPFDTNWLTVCWKHHKANPPDINLKTLLRCILNTPLLFRMLFYLLDCWKATCNNIAKECGVNCL